MLSVSQVVALYDVLHAAIAHGFALDIAYRTGGDVADEKARTIWPVELDTSAAGADLVTAFDSLRQERRTFRVDRIVWLSAVRQVA